MSIERALDSAPFLFGGLGHPREGPLKTAPWGPEMARSMKATIAHNEAKMNTPEGRKKASEMKRAEKEEKESNWVSRVILDRGNGWKPIWGSAKDEELRIYTLVDSGTGEHRFWGIKPIGMDIFEFWDKYDPEVKRYDDRQQETPVNPDAPVGPLIGEPPRSSTTKEAAAKLVKRQKTPDIDSSHSVRKSTAQSRKTNKNTQMSLAHKVDTGNPKLEDQTREMPRTNHVGSGVNRTTRTKTLSSSQQKQATEYEGSAHFKYPGERPASKAKVATKDVTMPPKRPRGRPPVDRKPTGRPPKQKKIPAVKGNVGVHKSRKADQPRPLAPSIHNMRTRGKGPAELLRLP